MRNCLICFEQMTSTQTWTSFFTFEEKTICYRCHSKLYYINDASKCHVCGRLTKEVKCFDCIRWEKHFQRDVLDGNRSLFLYNEFMQEVIATWKYRADYYMVEAFKRDWIALYKRAILESFPVKQSDLIISPIPLSNQRLAERGFNQSLQLAEMLNRPVSHLFQRKGTEKQSKKTRVERLQMDNPFRLIKTINQPVLLIDDIYTTGTTLRHAASLCKQSGCEQVYALTLCRG